MFLSADVIDSFWFSHVAGGQGVGKLAVSLIKKT